jgi:hypothetical protein
MTEKNGRTVPEPDIDKEMPLVGGINPRHTVRVGNTIRRPAHAGTPAIHALLRHLQTKKFPAPVPLGIDHQGREVLSFVDGDAGIWPWSEFLRSPNGLKGVGRMLRRYHEAVSDYSGPTVWMKESRAPRSGEVICHGDFGPHNLIWRDEEIVGVVDWEWAHPGPAIDDLAFAAWMTIPLRPDEDMQEVGFSAVPDRRERLNALLIGYGKCVAAEVIASVLRLQDEYFQEMQVRGAQGSEPWKTYLEAGLARRNRRENAWLSANQASLVS